MGALAAGRVHERVFVFFALCALAGDGHLILLDAHGDVVWKTDTSGQGYVALAVAAGPPQLLKTTQPDGFCLNAEVVGPVSLRSELLINEHWVSGDCLYILFLGDDGNVAIYDSDHSAHSAPRWSTGPNPGAVRMVLQGVCVCVCGVWPYQQSVCVCVCLCARAQRTAIWSC